MIVIGAVIVIITIMMTISVINVLVAISDNKYFNFKYPVYIKGLVIITEQYNLQLIRRKCKSKIPSLMVNMAVKGAPVFE